MFSRGLACSLVLGMTSIAFAGATVTLVPQTTGPYDPNEVVLVDVMLQQSPAGSEIQLRHVQLDFSASASELVLVPPIVDGHASNRFWSFKEPGGNCVLGTEANCGAGHHIDRDFTLPFGREKVVSMTYYFTNPASLTVDANAQRALPASAATKIATLQVNMPNNPAPMCYTLDALNATQTNPDLGGAELRFGFGTDVGGIPLTTWRVGNTAPANITGSSIQLCVGEVGGVTCTLASSETANCQSLWRTTRNFGRFTFNCTGGPLPTPPAGSFIVRQMTAGGTFGADIAANFTATVEAGNKLKLQANATQMVHRNWYQIESTAAWAGVTPFTVKYVVQIGDSSGDRQVNFADMAATNSQIPTLGAPDSNRRDINADGNINFTDLANTNPRIPSPVVAVPAGHTCP